MQVDMLFAQTDGSAAKDFTISKPMYRVLSDAILLAGKPTVKPVRYNRLKSVLGVNADATIEACKTYLDELQNVAPKDMRKSFMNIADECDVSDRWLQSYVGHASKSIIDRNYRAQDKLHKLRKHVVNVVFGSQGSDL